MFFCISTHMMVYLQFICALTLPIGKLVTDYVENNHEVRGKSFDRVSFFVSLSYSAIDGIFLCHRIKFGSSWQNTIA